jgi:hypothetical protein
MEDSGTADGYNKLTFNNMNIKHKCKGIEYRKSNKTTGQRTKKERREGMILLISI